MTAATKTQPLPLTAARSMADKLVAQLRPACRNIAIAGSIRRGMAHVHDIELVAIPHITWQPVTETQQLALFTDATHVKRVQISALDQVLERLMDANMLQRTPPPGIKTPAAWGERYKKLWARVNNHYGWVQIDLFIATPVNWGAIYAIRTGCSAFSNALVTYIKHHTPYRQEAGQLVYVPSRQPVPVPTERAYFATIGVPWIAPHLRNERAARRLYGYRWPLAKPDDHAVRAMIRARLEAGLD
ncbi:MAG: hypothetical protein Kow00120_00470 [Anaerolineae bacterium]